MTDDAAPRAPATSPAATPPDAGTALPATRAERLAAHASPPRRRGRRFARNLETLLAAGAAEDRAVDHALLWLVLRVVIAVALAVGIPYLDPRDVVWQSGLLGVALAVLAWWGLEAWRAHVDEREDRVARSRRAALRSRRAVPDLARPAPERRQPTSRARRRPLAAWVERQPDDGRATDGSLDAVGFGDLLDGGDGGEGGEGGDGGGDGGSD